MSLLTPPGTSHRDKENRDPGSSSRVVWSQRNQIHMVPADLEQFISTSASKDRPVKSILKKSSQIPLPFAEEKQREVTPVPQNVLNDPCYLQSPVSKIISPNSCLRDLTEGYSVLAARIRVHIDEDAKSSERFPLLEPLRMNRDVLAEAIVRDLAKAMMDPPASVEPCTKKTFGLPSPKQSPKKKKGMSGEQIMHVRDMTMTCHAAIRFLGVIWARPAVYLIFDQRQIGEMLTEVLAIPLSPTLPIHNGRKTCALSIGLLQVQCLPEAVLFAAKDRIAYAIRRGIEGELGKEGKKGSINDGYMAIHDLSLDRPATFAPTFTELLPSILAGLLSGSLATRCQACNALGGFTRACASLDRSLFHTRASAHIGAFLTTLAEPTATSLRSTAVLQESYIVRTLRTTLNATEPTQAAQGPVWALCVLANFIVLLGPALCTNKQPMRIIAALMQLAIRHKRSSVRALACIVWRCMAHAYFQPPLMEDTEETEFEDEDAERKDNEKREQLEKANREAFWKLLMAMVEMGAGTATIIAVLGNDSYDEGRLEKALNVLSVMANKGGPVCGHAMGVIQRLVSMQPAPESEEWDPFRLLSPCLFSCLDGLLSSEWKLVHLAVRPVFEDLPKVEDVRPLAKEDIADESVFNTLLDIWKIGLNSVQVPGDRDKLPDNIALAWDGLLKAKVSILQDANDDEGITEFAECSLKILRDVLENSDINFTVQMALPKQMTIEPAKCPVKSKHSKAALKILVVRNLWTAIRTNIPRTILTTVSEQFIAFLRRKRTKIINGENEDMDQDAWSQWAMLCAEVLAICDVDDVKTFWWHLDDNDAGLWPTGARSLVWCKFVSAWQTWLPDSARPTWENAVALLSVPFTSLSSWDMNTDELDAWGRCLSVANSAVYDAGLDHDVVLESVAETISNAHWRLLGSSTSPTRVADILLTKFEPEDTTGMPAKLFEFVNDTLITAYPPEPRNKVTCMWLIRSLMRTFDLCNTVQMLDLLEMVQDGLAIWIGDERDVLQEDEYSLDILPLYETVLMRIQSFPRTLDTLCRFFPVLESAFLGRKDKSPSAIRAFVQFWEFAYAELAEPTEGWPESIQNCLLASGLSSPKVSHEDEQPAMEECGADDMGYEADVSFQDTTHAELNLLPISSASPQEENEDELSFPISEDEEESVVKVLCTPSRTGEGVPPTQILTPCLGKADPHSSSRPNMTVAPEAPSPSPWPNPETPSNQRILLTSTPPGAPMKDKDSDIEFNTPPTITRVHPRSSAPRVLYDSPVLPFSSVDWINAPSENETLATPKRERTFTPGSVSATSFYTSPSKIMGNKENVSPIQTPEPRAVLGKRRRLSSTPEQDEVEEKPRRTKRGRFTVSPLKYPMSIVDSMRKRRRSESVSSGVLGGSESDERGGAGSEPEMSEGGDDDPFSFDSSSNPSSDSSPTSSACMTPTTTPTSTPSRKRARTFMDAVEIPPLSGRSYKWVEMSSLKLDGGQKRKRVLKTHSTGASAARKTVAVDDMQEPWGDEEILEEVRWGKRRRSSSEDRPESSKTFVESLLEPEMFDEVDVVAGSDDSVMQDQSLSPPGPSETSPFSPHTTIGQVTPRYVVSPVLHRVKADAAFDIDPPSDDSIASESDMGSSPSREHVHRRLVRSGSYGVNWGPVPLTMRTNMD